MAGGALGAGGRYLVNVTAMRLLGPGFPWATVFVNVVGSLVMGVLVGVFAARSLTHLHPFALTGVLGGFTTFSAFSLDAALLWERGEAGLAALYVGASVILSLAAVAAGLGLMRAMLAGGAA